MRLIFDTDESFSFETLPEWRALADRIAAIADECAAPHRATFTLEGKHVAALSHYQTILRNAVPSLDNDWSSAR